MIKVGSNWQKVGTLENGETFMYADKYYIRTDFNSTDDYVNCVNLENGKAESFNRWNHVIKVDFKLTIEGVNNEYCKKGFRGYGKGSVFTKRRHG